MLGVGLLWNGGGSMSETLTTARRAMLHRRVRFIVGFNLGLIVFGVAGLLPPTTSALLHNASTLAISLKSMTNLLPDKKKI